MALRFECPKCGGNVKVPDSQAGHACTCPRCNAAITAPGASGVATPAANSSLTQPQQDSSSQQGSSPARESSGVDELPSLEPIRLDEDLTAPSASSAANSTPSSVSPPSPRGTEKEPGLASNDKLVEEVDDDDEFKLADPEPLPDLPALKLDDVAALPAAAAPLPEQKKRKRAVDYFLACNVCETRITVTPNDVGTEVQCPDCLSKIEVTAPSIMERARYQDERREQAASTIRDKTLQDHMSDKLAAAERQIDEEEQVDRDRFMGSHEVIDESSNPFLAGTLDFLMQRDIIARWVVYGVFMCILLGVGSFLQSIIKPSDQSLLGMANTTGGFLLLPLFIVGVVCYVVLWASTLLNIVTETSIGREVISDWPELTFSDKIARGLVIGGGLLVASLPGAIVGWFATSIMFLLVYGTLSIVIFYPWFILSQVDNAGGFVIVRKSVFEAFKKDRRAWQMFFIVSGLYWFGTLAAAYFGIQVGGIGVIVGGAMLSGIGMLYARLLGKLAFRYLNPDAANVKSAGV